MLLDEAVPATTRRTVSNPEEDVRVHAVSKSHHEERLQPETEHLFWKLQIGGWLFIAVYGFFARVVTFSDFRLAFTLTLSMDLVGFLLTSAAHHYVLRNVQRLITIPVFLGAAAFSLACGTLQTYLAWYLRDLLFPEALPFNTPLTPVVYYTSVLLGWMLAYFCLRSDYEARIARLRRSEALAEAMRSELEQLRLQLAPHFLFNALNSVASEIHERPDTALEMVREIAGYLRYCLNQQRRDLCPLSEEVEAMNAYLRIQEIRFEDKLQCTVSVDETVRDMIVPHMILQGLVENAVKHGLKHQSNRIDIHVSVSRLGKDEVEVSVTNSGKISEADPTRKSIGHANLRKRLQLYYPEMHEFSLREGQGMVVARILLKGPACSV
ncbi:sensor histidine kinase [Roseibium aggregatum]|uniref:sensor histidine kinase n=1 Tax=Roseibium aggregatum TaxID=187304 RepID=UPI0025AC7A7E|nr:histidine kinase [Roseibium aggregatum]WJS06189.1 histidine kinase [Roseibium aggregatum]